MITRITVNLYNLLARGLLVASLLAGCARPPDPVAAAQAFYADHHDFFLLEDLPRHQAVLTPRFYAVLKQAAADEEYAIELDPWIDGQEGWIKGEPDFTAVRNDGRTAVVRMDFDFELDGIERKNATLALEWDGAARRWRVADLVGPDRCSFVDLHETWFRWRAAGEPGGYFEYKGQIGPD